MGILAVICGFPVYIAAAFIGAGIGGKTGGWVALVIAAAICFAAGWGAAENRRKDDAARDAQIRLGRHPSE